MKTRELIHLLQAQGDKEVLVKVENGLYYPITSVKTYDRKVVIVCSDVLVSAETGKFEPAKFINSVKSEKK